MKARPPVVFLVCLGSAVAACSGGDGNARNGVGANTATATHTVAASPRPEVVATAAAAPRPAGVPQAAQPVVVDREFGSATAPAGADPSDTELFFSMSCVGDVLAVVTNQRVLYAELPCDRALPESATSRFLGNPVQLRIALAEPAKLFLESAQAGSAQFTVGRMWMTQP